MYLAMLAQTGMSDTAVRIHGLTCNTVVTATGTISFQNKNWMVWKPVLMLLAFSTPACIAASLINIHATTYFFILGCCLFIAGLLILLGKNSIDHQGPIENNIRWWIYPTSMLIGFISGITGIGGGVYLSPLLHLSRWGSAKHIAAASSVYILVNSLAGLTIHIWKGGWPEFSGIFWLILAVFAGGFLGSRMSSGLFSQRTVRILTGVIIIFASAKILTRYL